MKKKKGRSLKALVVSDLLMFVCVCMLCYPIAADIWNAEHSSYMHSYYSETVESLDEADYSDILERARAYNESLVNRGDARFGMSDEERELYEEILRIPGTDVMAYLDAPTIGVEKIPIYHGTSNAVLQAGIGHYEGSSLPIGGPSTHTVLSGHTGMAGMKMFTDLHTIKDGDLFQITVLGEVLTYKVEERNQVYPNELLHLDIEEGEDYCTLITCVPIGVNSQRLLVKGRRVPTPTEKERKEILNADDSGIFMRCWKYLTNRFADYELIMSGIAIMILLFFIIPDFFLFGRKMKRRKKTGKPLD